MRWAVAASTGIIVVVACRSRPPAPPELPIDLVATALDDPRTEHPPPEARTAIAAAIARESAIEDAVFAAAGNARVHTAIAEPPPECLDSGRCFSDYLDALVTARDTAFAARAAPVDPAVVARLETHLDREQLAAAAERADATFVAGLARLPVEFRGPADAQPVW